MARFVLPRNIYFGRGALSVLASLEGRRAMLVSGGGAMEKYGFIQRAEAYLRQAGMEIRNFSCGDTEASLELVSAGAKAMREYKPDWVLAMGIGTCIHAAKLMWVYYEHPEARFSELLQGDAFPLLRQRARFAAAPSTSGTGGEVSSYTMVAGHRGGCAHIIQNFQLTPDLAILDPDLTVTMPPRIAAYTGMAALAHGVEAYAAPGHNPFTEPFAQQAVGMILRALPASCTGDEGAREEMHYAQCLAGAACSNGGLGLSHVLSDRICAMLNSRRLVHGAVCAAVLPQVLRFNIVESPLRYARLAGALGLPGDTPASLANSLVKHLETFRGQLGMAAGLRAMGVPEEEFAAQKGDIARKTMETAPARQNPRPLSSGELELLLEAIYRGLPSKKK